jgi:hypothetical protein
MRKTLLVSVLLAVISTVCFAQEIPTAEEPEKSEKSFQAQKFDAFGPLTQCDFSGRLDNFLVALRNDPEATGYIILYQGREVLPAEYDSPVNAARVRNYFRFRRFDVSRITLVNGGFREEVATELWLVPKDAEPPTPTDTVEKPEIPTGKTFLYDRNYLPDGEDSVANLDEYVLPAVKARQEAEERAWIEEQEQEEQRQNEEPSVETESEKTPDATEETETPTGPESEVVEEEEPEIEGPTPEEIEEAKFSWINERFGGMIATDKDARGVIIFYADEEYYDVGKLRAYIEEGKRRIADAAKLSPAKIKVVFGGYRSNPQTEFWIVPKKGERPKPTPEERETEENTQ